MPIKPIRLMAGAIGLAKVDATPDTVMLQFDAQPITPPAQILKFAQSRRDFREQGVARLVTQCVVDQLEVVEID